jgi:hypothetical protein
MKTLPAAILTVSLSLLFSGVHADEVLEDIAKPQVEQTPKLYRSPSERREAGLGRQLTDWLSVSGLAEVESEYLDYNFSGNKTGESEDETLTTLQLGVNITLSERVAAEFVLEYEVNSNISIIDEGILRYEGDSLGVEGGQLYVPFGEFYSHFVTGPIIEFGETRDYALVSDYELNDAIDVFAYVLRSNAEQLGESGGTRVDWGGGFEYASGDESVKIMASYLSDMAETDEQYLEDFDNQYLRRVGGLDVNALIGWETYEITAEYLGALRGFDELDPEEDRPWGTNFEVAWFPLHDFQFAARIETSSEVPDEPKLQYGVSATWLIGYRINLTLDYMYGVFKKDFAFDDEDNPIDTRHLVAAQLAMEF